MAHEKKNSLWLMAEVVVPMSLVLIFNRGDWLC